MMNQTFILFFLVIFLLNGYCVERCCQKYRCEIDSPPGGLHTCQQQKEFNKCDEDWMRGYCCQTCPNACPEDQCHTPKDTEYLAIDENTKNFIFHGNYVFLNGANLPWWEYGKDFGGDQSDETIEKLEEMLEQIRDSGGNVIRVWIFCEGTKSYIYYF